MQKSIYKNKKYWHFDGHKTIDQMHSYIENDECIKKHSFYPFLHYTMSFEKFNITRSVGERRKPKNREIYYCAHSDRYIYQKCCAEISNSYNTYCIEHKFNECSVAYRNNNPGKCNINFAKDVFKFIKNSNEAFIIVGDFHKFFDMLDHKYLYKMLLKCLNVEKLSEIQYKVFKNITHFCYIDINDLCKFKGIEQKQLLKLNEKLSTEELQQLKKRYLKRNFDTENKIWNSFGIPQGSPISAIYANVYMIEFDDIIKHFVQERKGIYRRYSDDFIIVLPKISDKKEQEKIVENLFKIIKATPRLILQETKTSCYYYNNHELTCVENLIPEQKNESKTLNYLGFSFDGENIKLRDKTITKYYYKLYRAIDKHLKREERKKKRISRHALIRKKSKYYIKDKKGRNFISYVERSIKQFPNEGKIKLVKQRNLSKISTRFNKNKK